MRHLCLAKHGRTQDIKDTDVHMSSEEGCVIIQAAWNELGVLHSRRCCRFHARHGQACEAGPDTTVQVYGTTVLHIVTRCL